MSTQIIIHFANIFERVNFGKLFANSCRIKTLTPTFCLMSKYVHVDLYAIRQHCPASKIIIKQTKGKRTAYIEWRG